MGTNTQLETLTADRDGAIGLWRGCLLVQVRTGRLRAAALVAMLQRLKPLILANRPLGLLAIVEGGAELPTGEDRAAQLRVLDELCARDHTRTAVVTLGASLNANLTRSAARVTQSGNPRVRRFDSEGEAARWLAGQLAGLGVTLAPTEIGEAARAVRELGEQAQRAQTAR